MNSEIKPGSFFEPDENPYQNGNEQIEQSRAFGPEVSERLQDQLEAFKSALNPNAEVIYYPCCQNDTTISQVFPNSRIIYADINPAAIKMLKEHQFEAVEVDATQFTPDQQPDLVLILNPSINPDKPASTVKEGGYLVCNNYHDTANDLHVSEDFELVGVVIPQQDGQTVLDRESLQDYFMGIDTDEELKKLRFSWGSTLTYENALDSVRRFGEPGTMQRIESGATSVIAEYKKVLEKFKKQALPGAAEIVFQDTDGTTIILCTEFPPKKGVADDLFIFRRKNNEFKTNEEFLNRKISDLEPIEEGRNEPLKRRTDLERLVEKPLLLACQELYDKNIITLSTSANKKDVQYGTGHIVVDFDSLSDRNKEIGKALGEVGFADDINQLDIKITITPESTFEEIQARALEIAHKFIKQRYPAQVWTLEQMRQIYTLEPDDESFGPESFIPQWFWSPEHKLFFRSEEQFRKAMEPIEE